ncbi:MAG: isocitrate/isopropylmalate dehydrogenase family protein [Bacteroidetes bacterium]|nr:isocitrate/isopropylmalate dehydrogenase family protein [Bacteroidota bacterium]
MVYNVTLIPGDGIGPEVVEATVSVLESTGLKFVWDRQETIGAAAVEEYGTPLPEMVLDSVRRNKVALKGPVTTPVGKGFKSVNVGLRQRLDLFANVRPCLTLPGIKTPFENVDLIIFRENTEGLYSGIENFDERLEIADTISRITRTGCRRIIEFAFDYARRTGRQKITLVHKANILKQAGAMFLDIGREVAARYPEIEVNDRIIDNMSMQLVMYPERYDCIVTTNLFGDILSDLCAGLVGGLGVVAGANIGSEYAIFEAVHGSAPDIAGQNKANPTALIRTGEMMLRHLGEHAIADVVASELVSVYQEGRTLTADVGGTSSTDEFAAYLSDRISSRVASLKA